MKAEQVELTVSQLQEDLNNSLTWFKKDDMGFGSIQEKYEANDIQIMTIQKHPKLVGIEPNTRIFIVRDDTQEVPNNFTVGDDRDEIPETEEFRIPESFSAEIVEL